MFSETYILFAYAHIYMLSLLLAERDTLRQIYYKIRGSKTRAQRTRAYILWYNMRESAQFSLFIIHTALKLFMNYIVNRPIDFSFLRDQEPSNQEARPLFSVWYSPPLSYPLSIHSQMLAREIYASSRHSHTQVRLCRRGSSLIEI